MGREETAGEGRKELKREGRMEEKRESGRKRGDGVREGEGKEQGEERRRRNYFSPSSASFPSFPPLSLSISLSPCALFFEFGIFLRKNSEFFFASSGFSSFKSCAVPTNLQSGIVRLR